MNKKIQLLIILSAITFFLVGVFFCGYYAPLQTGLIAKISSNIDMSTAQIIELVFNWICSIPCFLILILVIKVAIKIGNGNFFDLEVCRYLKVGGLILIVDCIMFFLANLVFVIIAKTIDYKMMNLLLSLVGISIGGVLFFGSFMLKNSIEYKEDSEAIV